MVVEVTSVIAKTLVPKVPFRIIGKVNIKAAPVVAAELSNPQINSLSKTTQASQVAFLVVMNPNIAGPNDVLRDDNYFLWEFNARMTLARKDLLNHVVLKPEEAALRGTAVWEAADLKALAVLVKLLGQRTNPWCVRPRRLSKPGKRFVGSL
jgi:hypothetical protein